MGVIVTAAHVDGPPLWTFHVPGMPEDALRGACARLDAAGDGWRIRTISTASSIYRDLHGTRASHRERGRVAGSHTRATRHEDCRPEVQRLGAIGRLDLLEPLRSVWA